MNLSKALLTRMNAQGLTQGALSRESGIPADRLTALLHGEKGKLAVRELEALAHALSCEPSELLNPEAAKPAANVPAFTVIRGKPKTLRVAGSVAAGVPILMEEEISAVDVAEMGRTDFALRVRGDSMIGVNIHDGDIVLIRAQEDVDDGRIAAVAIDDSITLKRVFHTENGVRLVGENPNFVPMTFDQSNSDRIRILGLAVAVQSPLM